MFRHVREFRGRTPEKVRAPKETPPLILKGGKTDREETFRSPQHAAAHRSMPSNHNITTLDERKGARLSRSFSLTAQRSLVFPALFPS